MFLKVILYFHVFSFCSKCIFVFFFKRLVQRQFREKLVTQSFPRKVLKGNKIISTSHRKSRYCLVSISRLNPFGEMVLGKNQKIFNFIQRLLRLSRDYFATKSFSRKRQCISRLILRLPNLQKTRVFNFYVVDVTFFQNHFISLVLPLSKPFQPKIIFLSNPIIFMQKSLQNHFKVCFPKHCFHFCLKFCRFQLRVLKIGDFQKLGWGSYFVNFFSKF